MQHALACAIGAVAAAIAVAVAPLIAAAAGDAPTPAGANGAAAECAAPDALIAIGPSLNHLAGRLARHQPLTIVAFGSSSTEGIGASAPSLAYPSRFEAELRARFPDAAIRVLNRGKGGEEAPQMLARIETDVVAEHPDLVVWQVGTNAVLRHDEVGFEEAVVESGLARLKASGTDVVLMDMQYAPRVIGRPGHAAMERLLADVAKRDRVGLFRRYALMQHWQKARPDGARMVGPDGLHMNDRGYGCLAAELAEAVADNWRRQQKPAASASQLAHYAKPAAPGPASAP
ncbi:MAG: SGNH/GDSL hydrolase family protein [Thiohalocapsa sp.]